jgi:predicted RNase H-like nuclease
MISDIVTGPFMNGMAQYGVRRGSVGNTVIIDDTNPPSTIVYTNTSNQLVDQITQKLIGWVKAGLVPAPPSTALDVMYLIIPPSETTPEMYNGAGDQ